MADTPDQKPARKVRRLRPAETVRERVEKAQAQDEKPKKTSKFKKVLKTILTPVLFLLRIIFWPIRILGRYLVPPYFKNAWKEVKQVTWPGTRQTFRLTVAVIIFSIIFGVLIAGVDYALDKIFREVLTN